jgi:hypothetical protein
MAKVKDFTILIIAASIILWLNLNENQAGHSTVLENQTHRLFVSPPKYLKYFTFGYNDVVADSMWVRINQDFGLCEQKLNKDGIRTGAGHVADCNKGWSYQMTKSIIELAPRNRITYYIGATVLNVIADDIAGAKEIFDLATERFPKDYEILFRAATFYLTELGEKKRAAELFQASAENGAPGWIMSLSAKLYSEEGGLLYARQMLLDFLEKNPNPKWVERIRTRLKDIDEKLSKLKNPSAK